MRLFSRAFCALPLVAALFATPALAVDFFFNTTHFQIRILTHTRVVMDEPFTEILTV